MRRAPPRAVRRRSPVQARPDASEAQRASAKDRREIALAIAAKKEAEGDFKAAEENLDIAEANGADDSAIKTARERNPQPRAR